MAKKVYELAKELEIAPLDLVDKLKSEGMDVKSHMSLLSDEDEQRAISFYQKKPANTEKKIVARKKVVKKVGSSNSTPETTQTEEVAAHAESAALKQDIPVVTQVELEAKDDAKKTVIRRKPGQKHGHDDEETELHSQRYEDHHSTDDSSSEGVSVTENVRTEERKPSKTSQLVSGLRVVSRPELKETTEERKYPLPQSHSSSGSRSSGPTNDLYKEKVHRFTPVYVPSKDANAPMTEEAKANHKRRVDAGEIPDVDIDLESDEKKKSKRLGGLALMMGAKKAPVNKAQMLLEEKAEEELKVYSALSLSGRPIYANVGKKKNYAGPSMQTLKTEVKDSKRIIRLHNGCTVEELAKKLSVKFKELVDKCLDINLLIKLDDYVGIGLANAIAELYQYRVENMAFDENAVIAKHKGGEKDVSKLPTRNPIVAIMGHVDHGKTTLLDCIRKAKVAAGEAGGITQHIGAYTVNNNGKNITFLDTPGHAAFAAMRQRGADATDIVILVVAADDGVMPQTRESIKFCKNVNKTIIVAVNKMDKPGANPDRVKQELSDLNLLPEDWGGTTQYVHVSALKGEGIDNLLEAISIQAEIMELKADPKGAAEGVVIESKVEQGRGPVATILVQSGTLNKGDYIVVGETMGRARSLTDYRGEQLVNAAPSVPVQILGLESLPNPGDIMNVVKNEREGRKIVDHRIAERKDLAIGPVKKTVSLEDFFASASATGEEKKILNLIVRSDVLGSYEAIKSSIECLGNDEVGVKVIGGGAGAITDSDVMLAFSTKGIVLGFNMRPVSTARRLADDKAVEIKTYSIIYELINDVKLALEGLLDPEVYEEFSGRAEVRETFSVPKIGVIAGSAVTDGKIERGCNIRLLREGKIVHDGKLSSLKRFKDDAKEVNQGYECGIGLEGYNDIKIGDIFEAYMIKSKKRTLDEVKSNERPTL